MVVPGYSETIAHNKKLVDALADRGFDAVTFSQPRKTGEKINKPEDALHRLGSLVLELVDSEVLNGKNVHAVAHSMGAAAVLKAAQDDPERFKSITLVQPMGMVGEQSFPELVGRVTKKVTKNQIGALKSQDPTKQSENGGYIASIDEESAASYSSRVTKAQLIGGGVLSAQPNLALKESLAAGKYDITEDIGRVMALGVPVNIVKAHSDELFDTDKVDDTYESGIEASSYSSVADPNARHDTAWMQPERTATIIDQLVNKN